MTKMQMIDFAELTKNGVIANLSGRHRGLAAREKYQLDWKSSDDIKEIEIVIPESLDSVTPSFIQGMFGPALEILNLDKDAFYRKFHFRAPRYILDQVEAGIAALQTSRDLKDLF